MEGMNILTFLDLLETEGITPLRTTVDPNTGRTVRDYQNMNGSRIQIIEEDEFALSEILIVYLQLLGREDLIERLSLKVNGSN